MKIKPQTDVTDFEEMTTRKLAYLRCNKATPLHQAGLKTIQDADAEA
ncbi:hypothetical protein [Lysinibacillus fusiformis]